MAATDVDSLSEAPMCQWAKCSQKISARKAVTTRHVRILGPSRPVSANSIFDQINGSGRKKLFAGLAV
jgi:hypothetical protein